MIVRKITPEEGHRVNEIFAIAFEQPLQNCPYEPGNEKATYWAAFSDEGEMMSTITVSHFQIQFDGRICPMGGIGGVATLPQYRRNGGIRGCFRALLPDLYAMGCDFSYLYPFSTAYYRKFGYECCVQKYFWDVNLSLLPVIQAEGCFILAEKNRPMTEAIRAVDAVWEKRFNMMVQHSEEDYQWTAEFNPAAKQEFTYVCFDGQNTPNAYTTFKLANEQDGRNLVCSRFFFTDRNGFRKLLQLFQSLAADHTYVKFQTPVIPALQYLMPEWSLGAVKWNLFQNAGMVRVINVQHVLEQARYIGSGRLTLEIHDSQIPENNGSFAVVFENCRAVSVRRTDASADLALDISAFSALIAGVCDFEEARCIFDRIEIRQENPCFRQVFYRKPMMITDYF